MPLKLYKMDVSPPVCAVLMVCEIHNIPMELIELNVLKFENQTPEFLKKNPMHTIPLLDDNGLYIQDSHVIITYLVDKYGKNDSLYPKDIKKRALVDQKLYFDVLLFSRGKKIGYPAVYEGVSQPSEKDLKDLREACGFLETFLTNTKFVAGDSMTIADVALSATVAFTRYLIKIDQKTFPKVHAWLSYMEMQPFYQKCTAAGTAELKELMRKCLAHNIE